MPANPLKTDPTQSIVLRKQMAGWVRKRFARVRSRALQLIVKEDAFGFGRFAANLQFATLPRNVKFKVFQQWLKQVWKEELFDEMAQKELRKFVLEGLRKGAARSFNDVRNPQRRPKEPIEEYKQRVKAQRGRMQEKLDFYRGNREEFLRSSFSQPVAQEKVELLAERAFSELEGITEEMGVRMGRVFADGMARGQSPSEVARTLSDELGVTRVRAERLARTEIIRAHAEGQLIALKALGVDSVGVMVEWRTAGDDRVCPLCAPLEGVVVKLSRAEGMLPLHPG